jgi:hypothetical protein
MVGGNASSNLFWDETDFGTMADKQWVNLQCSLPQAFTLREIGYTYNEDIGT